MANPRTAGHPQTAWRAVSATLNPIMSTEELRRAVEPAAVRLATLRASESGRGALRAAYMAKWRARWPRGDYAEADTAFHANFLSACGTQFLGQMQDAKSAMLRVSFEIVTASRWSGPIRWPRTMLSH